MIETPFDAFVLTIEVYYSSQNIDRVSVWKGSQFLNYITNKLPSVDG